MTAENLMNLLDSLKPAYMSLRRNPAGCYILMSGAGIRDAAGRLWESGVMKYGRNCAPTVPLRCWGTECQTIWFVMTRSLN